MTRLGLAAAVLLAMSTLAWAPGVVCAQSLERPDDPLGLAIREPRVRVIHSDRPDLPGSSMHLQRSDPWLAYKRGHSLFQREWRPADGVFALAATRPVSAAVNSCAMCHNQPFRSAGAGGNTSEPVGHGRNVPHLFGVGLIETIGIQVRQELLARHDRNRNGFFDVPAETAGRRAMVRAAPGVTIDFGSLDDLDGDGVPDLNDVILVRFVDDTGIPRTRASDGGPARMGAPGIAGYDIAVGIFSSSIGDHQFPALRRFAAGAFRAVMGFLVDDPTSNEDRGRGRDRRAHDGWGAISNAYAPQFVMRETGRPAETQPACDGPQPGITEGEMDLLEWYLANHPPPARAQRTAETERGRRVMAEIGCTGCHVADWEIKPADALLGYSGDRRFFDLRVGFNANARRLEGKLVSLTDPVGGPEGLSLRVPRRQGAWVTGIYSDFRHHDLGERFYEYHYVDGRLWVLRRFRTPPLWGVGSTAPYGHDGRSATLDEVIRRHSGAAAEATSAYLGLPSEGRRAVLAFLRSLVLYQPDTLAADIDGDDRIADMFRRGGHPLGPERFNPELLFRTAPLYQGWAESDDDDTFFSYALLNLDQAYGLEMEGLRDDDRDGIPDILRSGISDVGEKDAGEKDAGQSCVAGFNTID